MRIESVCGICGDPLTLEMPDDTDEGIKALFMRKIVPAVAHNLCFDNRWKNQHKLDFDERERKRACAWGGICPPLYQDTVLERVPSAAKEQVLAWEFGEKGLLLYGRTGMGKTRMAYYVLHREHLVGRMIVAMTHTEFSREAVRMAVADKPNVAARWVQLLVACDILFIDDLGKSKFTDLKGNSRHADELLFDVLEARIAHKRPCVFTTEDTGDSLKDRMAETNADAFLRRLRENCVSIAM